MCFVKNLQDAASIMGISLDNQSALKMIHFLSVLQEWSTAYNLTAIRSFEKMLTHHLLDSLSLVPLLNGSRILDVGSGAGFPGVPLAIYYPDRCFSLLDSNGKKIRFLVHVKNVLSLNNVNCYQERLEKYKENIFYNAIICRAVGNISGIIQNTDHLLDASGKWFFMKGLYPIEEMVKLNRFYVVHTISIPGIDAARHVIEVHK